MREEPNTTVAAPPAGRPRIVIVGAGFGGLAAAKALARAPVAVTVLDRTNHYLFQPLLYQVATGVLSPADIAVPTRFLLRRQRNVTVLLGDVTSIDLEKRLVSADDGRLALPFDYLIVATGARHSYFGNDDWEALAPGLKTLDDARQIRRRFLLALEEAEKVDDPEERRSLLTFVIVGGGPTGVELAGILPTLARKGFRRDFKRFDSAEVRVILLEGGPRLLPTFDEKLSRRACADLQELGVQCRTGAKVTRVTSDGVHIGDEMIRARTIFWAAGNAASPLIRMMGVETDRAGRAVVGLDLAVPGRPNVFVIGDAAAAEMSEPHVKGPQAADRRPQYVPGLAAAATQMGEHAARMIVNTLAGRPRTPFRYRDKGTMAVIGRGRAVADLRGLRLTGPVAFFTWLFVHLLYLAGFRNRLSVMVEWAYAYFTYRPGARLITGEDREAEEAWQARHGGSARQQAR
ncbi:MAG TPA: NAD(P)/FAD-dependent oxidoreductase [Vicinamibacterales bacterium]|nr:NAD(P)/FAD-dependent oxidoreductase [Vicinamibacterales bacterium]